MEQGLSYQMKVSEAAVRILAIYEAANSARHTIDTIAESMMACITLAQLGSGKEWTEVEVDVLNEMLSIPQLSDSLRDVVETILQRKSVEITTKIGDNIH